MTSESVGNAYLNVVPKVDGDAKAIGNKFGSQLSSGANDAVSTGSIAMGNILANAVTAAASAAAEAFKQAFTNIMDYEQLAGGAQKIFDEIDYSTIAKDAQNAFKDLNMSANDYLATINIAGATFAQTMGDAKGYQVAREGMLAISDYATGTGRNLDELNQKYQMITRSTASYQSIADQFAGILPATSKDFLEQAQAAGYLSESYKSLTEVPVAEYQEAVTKMLTKGVDDLGLAANTLHESESTMSGSLAMLSSSWQNFLTALGGGEGWDMSQVTADLVESLGAVAQNILPALWRIGQSIVIELPKVISDGLSNLAPTVRQALVDAFGENTASAFDTLVNSLGQVQEVVMQAFDVIKSIITDAMPVIQQAVVPVVEMIATVVSTAISAIMPIIQNVMSFIQANVVPIIQQVFGFISSTIIPIIEDIANAVQANMPMIQSVFEQVMSTIGSAVETVWPAIQNIIVNVLGTIQSVVQTVWPIIQNIMTTVWDAIQAVAAAVWPAIQGIVETAASVISGVIDGLSGIVGVVTGIFEGVKAAIENPIETAKGIVQSAIETIQNIINGAHLQLPEIKLPHFNIDGGEVPWGIGGQGHPPSISIDWYAHGGIVDGAQLVGVGEAGPEMILPKSGGLMAEFARAVSDQVSRNGGANQTYNIYANDPLLVAEVVASKQRRTLA